MWLSSVRRCVQTIVDLLAKRHFMFEKGSASGVVEMECLSCDVLPMLLVVFPLAVGLAATPVMVGIVSLAFLFVAYAAHCLRGFIWALGVAMCLALLVYSGAAIHSDVDNYLGPQVRLLTLPSGYVPDGDYSVVHCTLPNGLALYGAALYRIFGNMDLASSAFFLLLPAVWMILRQRLTRVQTVLLVMSPAVFPSVFSLMSDGVVYLLLLIALFALQEKNQFWLVLLSGCVACVDKPTAWLPMVLITIWLIIRFPKNIWKVLLAGGITLALVWPTLRMILAGGLSDISSDFLCANDDARGMGRLARLAYVYVGHWTTTRLPDFGVHQIGVDGASVDAFGGLFRALIWGGVGLIVMSRKTFRPWYGIWVLSWISVLTIPSLYIGYARYTPLLVVAGLLPWVVLMPRIAIIPVLLLDILPIIYLGWRIVLSSEVIMVANHATAVQSSVYNLRATFRSHLTEQKQRSMSGSLRYTYTFPDNIDFPKIPRQYVPGVDKQSFSTKSVDLLPYVFGRWFPWMLSHIGDYVLEVGRFRWRALTSLPRGATDGLQAFDP